MIDYLMLGAASCAAPAFKRSFLIKYVPASSMPLFGCALCFGLYIGMTASCFMNANMSIVDHFMLAILLSCASYTIDQIWHLIESISNYLDIKTSKELEQTNGH